MELILAVKSFVVHVRGDWPIKFVLQ